MTVQIAQGRIIALVGPEQLGVAVYNQAAQGKGSGLECHVPSRQAGGKLPLIVHILGTKPDGAVVGIAQGFKGLHIELFEMGEIVLGLRKGQELFRTASKTSWPISSRRVAI